MGDQVSLDILTNHILLGLSTKCLLRCRCVCKQWFNLISAPEFSALRIQNQPQNYRILFGPLFLRNSYCTYGEDPSPENPTYEERRGIFYTLDIGLTSPPTLNRLPGFPVHTITNYTLVRTLGYGNGMLCMLAETNAEPTERHLFFGNPSTGSYKILPDVLDNGPMIVGFGYDSCVDDYKFVRVDNITRNAHVFSLQSNSWTTNMCSSDKRMMTCPGYPEYTPPEGCLFGDSIYWLVENKKIVAFNLREEEFMEIPLPCDYKYGQLCSLKVVQSSLCFIKRFQPFSFSPAFQIDMWSFNKENNCWVKLMEQARLFGATGFRPLFFTYNGRILCCVEKSDLLTMHTRTAKLECVMIDRQTGKSEDFPICMPRDNFLDKYYFRTEYSGHIDTLISPN